MYPYNRNTRLYAAKVQAKEEGGSPALSDDRRLLELLQLALGATDAMVCRYQALLAEPELAGSADILKTMLLDEQKHSRRLKEVIYSIYGPIQTLENTESTEDAKAAPAPEAADGAGTMVEETLLAEMDDVGFFRDLLLSMPEEELRDSFYEIVTNKQNHCSGLGYLFAKYFS